MYVICCHACVSERDMLAHQVYSLVPTLRERGCVSERITRETRIAVTSESEGSLGNAGTAARDAAEKTVEERAREMMRSFR